ncbi:hypothetical protein Syun_003819 [Stephania yunnanensis]|uniref:Uncharacterized protein n=1 Tax=Stephania yunnanensis TaxID=152371 RepID=A0AAP0L3F6_9MAGN
MRQMDESLKMSDISEEREKSDDGDNGSNLTDGFDDIGNRRKRKFFNEFDHQQPTSASQDQIYTHWKQEYPQSNVTPFGSIGKTSRMDHESEYASRANVNHEDNQIVYENDPLLSPDYLQRLIDPDAITMSTNNNSLASAFGNMVSPYRGLETIRLFDEHSSEAIARQRGPPDVDEDNLPEEATFLNLAGLTDGLSRLCQLK